MVLSDTILYRLPLKETKMSVSFMNYAVVTAIGATVAYYVVSTIGSMAANYLAAVDAALRIM